MSSKHIQENQLKSRLSEVFGITDPIVDKIIAFALQMGELSAADIEQLVDIAEQDVHASEIRDWLIEAKDNGDSTLWLRLSGLLDKTLSARRMIMRDLKLTRITNTAETSSKKDEKAKGKSGTDWEGIL